jgi:hypothetical protein
MINILSRISKLRGPNELRVRGVQAVHAVAERLGWSSLAKLPSEQALLDLLQSERAISSTQQLLEHFQTSSQAKFFVSFRDRDATVAELRRRWPRAEIELLSRADRILAGSFDLLGLHDLNFGERIDWHLEPLSVKRAPAIHWSKLDQLAGESAGDNKVIWELNRHQYFITLGQAYWLTGDERYAKTFVSHLESWMAANPPKLGINWASSLEIGFRSISWLWAFHFFKGSPSLSSSTFTRALKCLYLNARHIETYLSTYFSPNTHLTGEALGLFYLGALLPEFKEAERWRKTGKRILLDQLPVHVKPDGVYFEQSSYYHRYTTDFYTHFLILSRANGETVPSEVEEKLQSLIDHLMYITRPDGTTPFFGDDDGGRLLPLHPRPANDFRATLSTGAAIFGRTDYKFVASRVAEETLWLLGPDVLRGLDEIEERDPPRTSSAFEDGGYYIMRDGWSKEANYLLFDCGPHGTDNCGHAHADALSFEMVANGRTSLVDPGTFTYTGSKDLRSWFRSSLAHNTLTIDGASSSVPAGPFSWQSVAKCELEKWTSRDRFDYVAGRHDGYLRFTDPVKHARSILFLKHDYWIIRDQVRSKSGHRADVWFHFDSPANPLIEAPDSQVSFLSERDGDAGLDVYCFGNGQWRREEAWVSHCYAHKEPARIYAFTAQIKGDSEIITFLLPQRVGTNWRAREIEAIGGRAFEIAHENGLDVVMIRTAERVETARLASNFEWTWTRFPQDGGLLPEEFVLLHGQTLELEGREILKSARRISYLVASRLGDEFRVETDEGILDLSLPISDLESWFANSTRKSAI